MCIGNAHAKQNTMAARQCKDNVRAETSTMKHYECFVVMIMMRMEVIMSRVMVVAINVLI